MSCSRKEGSRTTVTLFSGLKLTKSYILTCSSASCRENDQPLRPAPCVVCLSDISTRPLWRWVPGFLLLRSSRPSAVRGRPHLCTCVCLFESFFFLNYLPRTVPQSPSRAESAGRASGDAPTSEAAAPSAGRHLGHIRALLGRPASRAAAPPHGGPRRRRSGSLPAGV